MDEPAKNEKKIKVEVVKEEPGFKGKENNTPQIESQKEKVQVKEQQVLEKVEIEKVDNPTEEKAIQQKTPFWILFLVFLLGLTLGAGLIGGIFYYKSKVEKSQIATSSPTPETLINKEDVKETPKPEETKISDLKVLILNGSGIKGEAGKVEALLKEAGFEKTETGNADSYDYKDTNIFIKPNINDSVYEKIIDILEGYSLKKADLETSSGYDIKIIVGKTKN
ncbi:MAG: hypothetical protein KatS3mg088_568 [Patescibacteria group bacterium]|nr:MAG: hypothetical protein KatS3mg088_568 [Patescibacteria group bacterium]